ncbi:MAG: ribosomal RNA small subunit methyltransferase A [Chthoniobacterales bacterium]|nr:ribosomal RNA small subunit methyltransferase A [Chthoniobacterales bacterium]
MRLTDIRSALDELGLRPSKSLGQNFLHDQNLARAIAATAVPDRTPFAVEIGPGLGALTTPLLERCDKLLLIEKDARLAAWLEGHLPADRAQICHADAVEFDWRPLMPHGPFPLVGNLPYYATSPILRNFLGPCSPVNRAVFAVQSEFADRLAAGPDSPDYSALTVRVQRLWSVRRERSLPPSVFHPEPGIDSALVALERRPPRHFLPVRAAFFDNLVQRGFSQRRKQLRSLLGIDRDVWSAWCDKAGLPTTARAENLPAERWIDLARTLDPSAAAPAQHDGERFDVVDEDDRTIGTELRSVVHDRNLLHRAVHILVFNDAGELLLQKRSAWKDRAPSVWDSSAAGHLEPGEDYAAGATRETEEELGIRPDLQPLGKIRACSNTGREFVEVFRARHDGPFVLPPAEIEDAMFFPLFIIRDWIAARPQDFAPGFWEVWKLLGEERTAPPTQGKS